jgi:hypothetical protein
MTRPPDTSPSDRLASALTALADGSLARRKRARIEAELARSPELRDTLARQRRAVEAVRSVDLAAPAALRTRVEAAAATAPARRPARRLAVGLALAGATAAVTLAVALSLPDATGGPSVVEASELSELPPTGPAPQPAAPKLLDTRAEGLPFPDWAEKFGWRATGVRRDELDGRRAVTVFYEKDGRTIAYTILSGEALDWPDPAASAMREGTRLRHVRADGRTIVTWRRDGLTCILSGAGIPATKLLDLAGWKVPS